MCGFFVTVYCGVSLHFQRDLFGLYHTICSQFNVVSLFPSTGCTLLPNAWSLARGHKFFSPSHSSFVISNLSSFLGKYLETLADAKAALQLRPNYMKAIERGMIEIAENS